MFLFQQSISPIILRAVLAEELLSLRCPFFETFVDNCFVILFKIVNVFRAVIVIVSACVIQRDGAFSVTYTSPEI